jgi:hypothetical protein
VRTSKSSPRSAFSVGDLALFTYIKGDRRAIVPVVVSHVVFRFSIDTESNDVIGWELTGYIVSSGRGGELRAQPADLRPDTALERIVDALDVMVPS